MSITLELTSEEETLVRRAARREGQEIVYFIKSAALATARNHDIQNAPPDVREKWTRLTRLGLEAGAAAKDELRAKGIGVVFLQEGELRYEQTDNAGRTQEKI